MAADDDHSASQVRCNKCWKTFDDEEAVITTCSHLFCVDCTFDVVENGDGLCPICETLLSTSGACRKVDVNLGSDDNAVQELLTGYSKETALQALYHAWEFLEQQQTAKTKEHVRRAKASSDKKLSEAKAKLVELCKRYKKLKKKSDEQAEEINNLQADKRELQDRYEQKCREKRKLEQSSSKNAWPKEKEANHHDKDAALMPQKNTTKQQNSETIDRNGDALATPSPRRQFHFRKASAQSSQSPMPAASQSPFQKNARSSSHFNTASQFDHIFRSKR